MDHEIRRGAELIETLGWDGPPRTYPEPEAVSEARSALRLRAIARAYELGGLSYERRNAGWLESDHIEFDCVEASESEVAVTTPIGVFRLRARRSRRGEMVTSSAVGPGAVGDGRLATEDQVSPPVRISGRLCEPSRYVGWKFQPSNFTYADGTVSDYLGSYMLDISWETEPTWPQ